MGLLDRITRGVESFGSAVLGGIGGIVQAGVPILAASIVDRVLGPVGAQPGFDPGFPGAGPFATATPPFVASRVALPLSLTGGGEMPFLPGGAPIVQAGFPSLGPGLSSAFGSAIGSFFGTEGAAAGTVEALRALRPGAAPGTLFQVGGPRLRAVSSFRVTNPSTGRDVWYRNVGQPILWSGDLRVCKKVRKVARLAARSSGKR